MLQVAHPVVVADLPRETRFCDLFLRKQGIHSALAVPLTLQDRSFGALAACTCKARRFDDDDVLFVETIAHLVATTIARNQAENLLARERRLSSEVLHTIDAMVLMLDSQWQIVRMNTACQRVTGFALHEVKNRPIWSVFAVPEEVEAFRSVLEKLHKGVSSVSYESHLLTKHSERRHIAWSCGAMIDRSGKMDAVVASGIDITRQRVAEERARCMEAAVEEARRASPAGLRQDRHVWRPAGSGKCRSPQAAAVLVPVYPDGGLLRGRQTPGAGRLLCRAVQRHRGRRVFVPVPDTAPLRCPGGGPGDPPKGHLSHGPGGPHYPDRARGQADVF